MKTFYLLAALALSALVQAWPLAAQTRGTCSGYYRACMTEAMPYGVAVRDRCKDYLAACKRTGSWCTRTKGCWYGLEKK
jgi:hypothetical protein